ncbi:PLC-like phosphodiesterase [Polychaeton citri CBS 116435]|uniref:PLC-like phosphodiesterase n=1 Tax=Polychaeton citri CBS 116435 TaxID=1314669 RepID=A0A9P4US32_9PEZI|nr:PLC-like phosphodiesterase [Polychaeton citri CBS 116435]
MPPSIIIRNLTAQPLTLKLVERYEAPNPRDFPPNGGFSVSNITSNITDVGKLTSGFSSLLSNATGNGSNSKSPTHAQLGEKAETFTKQDVDVRMEAFTTHRTDIQITERGPNEILRLTFQGDGGGRWRLDVPTPSSRAQNLTALKPNPAHEYAGIYIPEPSFLALWEKTDLKCWMREFKDETPLSALSIPGTHNSPTCHKALPSVRCQAVRPREQLENGVRFFDIRVQPMNPDDPKDDNLQLVHGVFPISLTGPKYFRHLVDMTHEFLKENPSETIIFSLKREGTGNATDQQLSQILRQHYTAERTDKWYTEPRVPHLGEARGKIVLLRRFALHDDQKKEWGGRGWALNAENWAYNTPDCTCGDVRVQDFCEVLETENIDKKIQLCCDHFERAAAVITPVPGVTTDADHPVPPGPLYLNFLSASNFWKVGCWPDKIAAKLNPAVTAFICEKHDCGDKGIEAPGEMVKGDGGVGIVVTDWEGKDGDWDLTRSIVGMNSRLLLRQRGIGWR